MPVPWYTYTYIAWLMGKKIPANVMYNIKPYDRPTAKIYTIHQFLVTSIKGFSKLSLSFSRTTKNIYAQTWYKQFSQLLKNFGL